MLILFWKHFSGFILWNNCSEGFKPVAAFQECQASSWYLHLTCLIPLPVKWVFVTSAELFLVWSPRLQPVSIPEKSRAQWKLRSSTHQALVPAQKTRSPNQLLFWAGCNQVHLGSLEFSEAASTLEFHQHMILSSPSNSLGISKMIMSLHTSIVFILNRSLAARCFESPTLVWFEESHWWMSHSVLFWLVDHLQARHRPFSNSDDWKNKRYL